MKNLLVVLAAVAFVVITNSTQATLLMYESFDYTAGDRLGGSGTSPLGQTNPNGQQWITRSPAGGGTYSEANDTLIVSGNLSYPGLSPSLGNSVRYGSSANNGAGLYTDAIDLPGAPITEGSLYYSMIVRLNGAVNGSIRTSYASLSTESADPGSDAGLGLGSSSGTAVPLPGSAWIRNSTVLAGEYQLGGGKWSTDGLGTSAGYPNWQGTGIYANQQGNTTGGGQDYATIGEDLYFIVMKYTFDPNSPGNTDKVSIWVNPIASTLGYNGGEALAGALGGSYYSGIDAYVTGNQDASQLQSFLLIGQAVASSPNARSIDASVDEIRIGTTWADVTPVPEPGVLALTGLGLMGLLSLRRRNS